MTQLNREALAAIDKREFEKARELLKRALDLCKSAGLEQHPAAARTHIHMGVVIIQGFKNHELGRKQFAKALAIDPNITITKTLSTPGLEEAFAEAKAGGGALAGGEDDGAPATPPGGGARPAGETRTDAPSSSGFSYHTVSEVKQGSSIVVTVTVDESLKFSKLVLAYREQGTSEFLGREMEPVGEGAYRAEIPASATSGSSVAYYMEAQDDQGQPVGSRGTETRPLVISFAATAKPSKARADAAVERKAALPTTSEDEDEGDRGKILRRPAGRQRLRLHLGHGRGERRHAGGGHGIGRASRAHRAGDRLLVEARRHAFGTGPVPAGDGDDGADGGRPDLRTRSGGAGGVREGDLVHGHQRQPASVSVRGRSAAARSATW